MGIVDLSLPPELCDAVIDHCCDSPGSLSACSLVCKSWLPRARSNLFSTIQLKGSNIQTLQDLLKSEYCTVTHHIRSSVVFLQVSSHDEYKKWFSIAGNTLSSAQIRLSALVLVCVPIQLLVADQFASLASTLTSLTLAGTLWYDTNDSFSAKCRRILEFAGTFPKLEKLEIEYGTPGRILAPTQPEEHTSFRQISLPHLRKLQLGDIPYNVLLPWFLVPNAIDLPKLEELSFYIGYASPSIEVELLQEFLDTICAPTVEKMRIYFAWESLPALNLNAFDYLRTLDFHARSGDKIHHTKLFDLISTIQFRSRPLLVSVPNDPTIDLINIDGVRWSYN